MERKLRAAIGATVCATTIGLSAAQTATRQNPADASTARHYVVIGCVGREAPSATRGQGAAAEIYSITDTRGTPPLKYRLDGAADRLRAHVGRMVEIEGPISVGPSPQGGTDVAASMPTLKVQSLTYISTACSK